MEKNIPMCARATFVGSSLTNSINHQPGASLIETVFLFKEFFEEEFPNKQLAKIELFLNEGDMHAEKKPFSTVTFQ